MNGILTIKDNLGNMFEDTHVSVKQSGFALLGEASKHIPDFVRAEIPALMPVHTFV